MNIIVVLILVCLLKIHVVWGSREYGMSTSFYEWNSNDLAYDFIVSLRTPGPYLSLVSSKSGNYCNEDETWFHYNFLNKASTTFKVEWSGFPTNSNSIKYQMLAIGMGDYIPSHCLMKMKFGDNVFYQHDCSTGELSSEEWSIDEDSAVPIEFTFEFTTPEEPSYEFSSTVVFQVKRSWDSILWNDYQYFQTENAAQMAPFPQSDFENLYNLGSTREIFKEYFENGQTIYGDFSCDWYGIVCGVSSDIIYIHGICFRNALSGALVIYFPEMNLLEFLILENNYITSVTCSSSSTLKRLSLNSNHLSSLNIQTLATCFRRLESLDCGNNGQYLSPWSLGLSKNSLLYLTSLNLESTSLIDASTLKDAVRNLEYLDLSGNSLESTSFASIICLTTLKHLDLARNSFTTASTNEYSFNSVSYVINPNHFLELTYLDLNGCSLRGNFPCISSLNYLDLSSNDFSEMNSTDFLGCYSSALEYLYLNDVIFISHQIPDFSTLTPALKELHISGSDFSSGVSVPTPFPDTLEILIMSDSKFTFQDNTFWGIRNLREIDLSRSSMSIKLSELTPDSIGIEVFTCAFCGITETWPGNLALQFPSLKKLSLQNNVLRDFQVSHSFDYLNELRLSQCNLNFVGNISTMFPSLTYLDLQQNKITQIGALPPTISRLLLSDNLLTKENWSNDFFGLPALFYLSIDNNRLFVDVSKFSPISTNLRLVYMQNCFLYGDLPQSFLSSSNKRYYLNNNFIFNDVSSAEVSNENAAVFTETLISGSSLCAQSSSEIVYLEGNALQGWALQSPLEEQCGNSIAQLNIGKNPLWCYNGLSSSNAYSCVDFKVLGPFRTQISRHKLNPILQLNTMFTSAVSYCPSVVAMYLQGSFDLPCSVASGTTTTIEILGSHEYTTLFQAFRSQDTILLSIYWDIVGSVDTVKTVHEISLVDECPVGLFLIKDPIFDYCGCDFGQSGTAGVLDECSHCQKGLFSDLQGQMSCKVCPVKTYSSSLGSTTCQDCPENTETIYGELATSIQSCYCVRGFYGDDPTRCKVCPEGGVCPGGTKWPDVDNGFWRYPHEPDAFYKCNPPEACKATSSMSSECEVGYTGDLCGTCVGGEYYRLGGYCYECPNYSGFLLFLLFFVIFVGVCALLYHSEPRFTKLHSLGIVLTWLQLIALFGSIPVSWPNGVQTTYNVLSFTNLNIELFSPECSVQMSYWVKLYLKLLSPVFFVCILGSFYLLQTSIGQYYPWVQAIFNTPLDEIVSLSCIRVADSGLRRRDMNLKSRYVYAFCVLMIGLYTLLASTSTEPFNCVEQTNGIYTMARYPSQECFDTEWYFHINFILFFNLFYIIGIPSTILFILMKYSNQIFEPDFLNPFGALVLPYKSELYRWEVINLSRRALMIFIIDFGQYLGSVYIQLFLMLSILFGYLVVQVFWTPYRTPTNNKLTFVWVSTGIFCLFGGVIFRSSTSVPTKENEAFGWLVGIMFIFASIYSFSAVLREFRNNLYVMAVEKRDNKRSVFLRSERMTALMILFPDTYKLIWHQMAYHEPSEQEKFFKELDTIIRSRDGGDLRNDDVGIQWMPNRLYSDAAFAMSEDEISQRWHDVSIVGRPAKVSESRVHVVTREDLLSNTSVKEETDFTEQEE